MKYLPNPFFNERFVFDRSNVKKRSILWVRAFTGIYNPDLAVKTLSEVINIYPDATLTMVGPDMGLLVETEKLIEQLRLTNAVKITGPVPNSKLASYYQTHEVLINTTSFESFGVALMEAASCGVPIVSTNVGEIPFLWKDGTNILLTDGFEAQQMAAHVIRLFKDEALARTLPENARRNAQNFSWDNIESGWKEALMIS